MLISAIASLLDWLSIISALAATLNPRSAQANEETDIEHLQPSPIAQDVIHTQFGIGQVLRYKAENVSILFEPVGYKTSVTKMIAQTVKPSEG